MNAHAGPGGGNSSQWEKPLTEAEMQLRDHFVSEFLKDFNAFEACLRVGFVAAFAMDWSRQFMSEGYVQRQIAWFTRKAEVDNSDEIAADKSLIVNVLRQATQNGPYASRVSAAAKLAEIRGFAKPDPNADAEQSLVEVLKDFAKVAPV